jgi:hypothetical protein
MKTVKLKNGFSVVKGRRRYLIDFTNYPIKGVNWDYVNKLQYPNWGKIRCGKLNRTTGNQDYYM